MGKKLCGRAQSIEHTVTGQVHAHKNSIHESFDLIVRAIYVNIHTADVDCGCVCVSVSDFLHFRICAWCVGQRS